MTTFQSFSTRNRDQQDGIERHVWGEKQYIQGGGSIIKVRGTDTEDYEVSVINMGYGFNLPANSNAEVHLLSMGSDQDMKFAIPNLPHDKQREWAEGAGGIQHPTTPDRAVEINNNETWLQDGTFKAGPNKELTITISGGNIAISTSGEINLTSSKLTHNGLNIGSDHVHGGVTPGGSDTAGPH